MVHRLRVHTLRGQSQGAGEKDFEYLHRLPALRTLARRQLDVRPLGPVLGARAGDRDGDAQAVRKILRKVQNRFDQPGCGIRAQSDFVHARRVRCVHLPLAVGGTARRSARDAVHGFWRRVCDERLPKPRHRRNGDFADLHERRLYGDDPSSVGGEERPRTSPPHLAGEVGVYATSFGVRVHGVGSRLLLVGAGVLVRRLVVCLLSILTQRSLLRRRSFEKTPLCSRFGCENKILPIVEFARFPKNPISPDTRQALKPNRIGGVDLYCYAYNNPVLMNYNPLGMGGGSIASEIVQKTSSLVSKNVSSVPKWIDTLSIAIDHSFSIINPIRTAIAINEYEHLWDLMRLDGVTELPGLLSKVATGVGWGLGIISGSIAGYEKYASGASLFSSLVGGIINASINIVECMWLSLTYRTLIMRFHTRFQFCLRMYCAFFGN